MANNPVRMRQARADLDRIQEGAWRTPSFEEGQAWAARHKADAFRYRLEEVARITRLFTSDGCASAEPFRTFYNLATRAAAL